MKQTFIIKDIKSDTYYMGCDSDGKPYFGDIMWGNVRQFDTVGSAVSRIEEQRVMWGDGFLKNRMIQIIKIRTTA